MYLDKHCRTIPLVNAIASPENRIDTFQERAPARRLPRAVHGHPRRRDRQRRAAVDARRAPFLDHRPAMGRERVHVDVRRLPDARRPLGRPARAPARVPRRHRDVRAVLARVRARGLARSADRRARRSGPQRRSAVAGHAVDHHLLVRRGPRAQPRAGGMGRRRRPRRVVGRAARRRPHPDVRVAGDLRRERAARNRRSRARITPDPGDGACRGHPPLRRDGRGARNRQPRQRDVRDRPHRHARLGLDRCPRATGGRPRPARGVPAGRGEVCAGAARAAVDLPDRAPPRRQRDRRAALRLAVSVVVLPDAVPAAGAPLRRDRRGARVPADDPVDLRGVDAGSARGRPIRAAPGDHGRDAVRRRSA